MIHLLIMPNPTATPISFSAKQHHYLKEIVRQITNPYRLVRRASIILSAAARDSNSSISRQWQLDRNQVRYWRQRWRDAQERLMVCEQEEPTRKALKQQILATLRDEQRPGVPPTFTPEQVVQIVAFACEEPTTSGRSTNEEIADEAIKRGIASSLSASSVRRFWGGGPPSTPSQSLLAHCRP